ncbi:hypothetical protein Sme01_25560 [Sphaerisporangium melleum]|uniref:Uncharacterized protein n=1 Tax=Sphaerisporangium melleum TaxID=321316 RepID=A0A917QR86_9ACTN|nr:hypothetical protein [Sphaerisporangium melleum]GGK64440.1 hypothetical protein GCM10007964_04380 [Sphaerisporangium melleum]GII70080.1 hypothetical protein Sme01_25560 [Sphaerisporangium melleum]
MRFHRAVRPVEVVPALAALLAGVLALGSALGPGFVLRYDMVFVPGPPLTWPEGGFPRAVPSDQVVALLAHVVPAAVLQKAILLGIFLLAGTGAAALISRERLEPIPRDGLRPGHGSEPSNAPAAPTGSAGEDLQTSGQAADTALLVARVAAAVFYVWNAYLAQRLLLGQWALLLGYAGLPWAVRAAMLGGWRRLIPALLPAAAGGFQAMLVTALTVLPVAAVAARGQPRVLVRSLATLAVLSLPWAVPALLSDAVTDPRGVEAFAARADGPFGTAGSLLALGGIWNAEADVPGQSAWWLATARLVVGVFAVIAFARLRETVPYRAGLLVAATAGLVIALTGAYVPGVLKELITWWPGFGPLRDGQLYIAPLALVQAVGFGVLSRRTAAPVSPTTVSPSRRLLGGGQGREEGPGAAGRGFGARVLVVVRAVGLVVSRRVVSPSVVLPSRRRLGGGRGRGEPGAAGRGVGVLLPGVVAVCLPVLVLPSFAWGAVGRLAAVRYPADWQRVRAIVNGDPRPGALLSLPWSAQRAFVWNGGRVVLDPATKGFARRVVWNDGLAVGLENGRLLRIAGEDPLGRRVGAALDAESSLRAALRGVGIRYVLIAGENENTFRSRLDGAVLVYQGGELVLLRL